MSANDNLKHWLSNSQYRSASMVVSFRNHPLGEVIVTLRDYSDEWVGIGVDIDKATNDALIAWEKK